MDTKDTYVTSLQWIVDVSLKELEFFQPDLMYCTDDIALELVGIYHTNTSNDSLPILFTGINIDPQSAYPQYIGTLDRPSGLITGKTKFT